MKRFYSVFILCLILCVGAAQTAFSEEPFPDYIQKAQSLFGQANTKTAGLNEFADALLIGKNYLRSAEAEFRKNLSWSGKLDEKAEPTVRYFATMARLQAQVILSRTEKIAQDKEQKRLEGLATAVKGKIKVFDDKNAEIASLKGELAKRDASIKELTDQITLKTGEIEQRNSKIAALSSEVAAKTSSLAATESKGSSVGKELDAQKQVVAEMKKRIGELSAALDSSKAENLKLRGDLSALAAQKGAVESQSREQIEALNRQKEFLDEVGKLGGVIKSGSDNMTVIFPRSGMLRSPKNDILTADGNKTVGRVADLLSKYPEYRVKIKVHGFGQGKAEDASATDRMARLIREALVEKGKLEPAAVEALGAGVAEPIYAKTNPEGNRRVEVTFVKK